MLVGVAQVLAAALVAGVAAGPSGEGVGSMVAERGGGTGGELSHPEAAVDALLDELEAADEGLASARADVTYIRHDLTLDSVVTRMGELVYLSPAGRRVDERGGGGGAGGGGSDAGRELAEGERADGEGAAGGGGVFAVTFDVLIDDLGRKLDRVKRWVFDGRWLVEQDFASKSYVRREIARPGEDADPMRLGEGPLPIPIGQAKRAILERYRVSMPAVTAGLEAPENQWERDLGSGFVSAVEGRAVQLRLVPRVAERGGFDEIRLWYRRDGVEGDGSASAGGDGGGEGGRLLPILAKAVKEDAEGSASDVAWVFLSGVETNVAVDRRVLLAPPPEGEGWSVDVRRLPAEGAGATPDGGADRASGGGS